MKKMFLLLAMLLFTMTAMSQKAKKMVKIEGMIEVQSEVVATVLTANSANTLIQSKNKVDLYEITQPNDLTDGLIEGWEYHFFLLVQDCDQCDKKSARVIDYHPSVGQTHKNINETRNLLKTPND